MNKITSETIKKLRTQGYSVATISSATNTPRCAVVKFLRAQNLYQTRPKSELENHAAAISRLVEANVSAAGIAMYLKTTSSLLVSRQTVLRFINRNRNDQ